MARHSYKTALKAKGIRPIPPYRQLRSAHAGAHEIYDPALVEWSGLQAVRRKVTTAVSGGASD